MTVSYDRFTEAFLAKITEYDFAKLYESDRQAIVDGYMKRAASKFNEVCKYVISTGDDDAREYTFDGATEAEVDEIVDIVTDGMLMQWLNQYLYKQENLENLLNTECVRFRSNAVQKAPTELLEHPESLAATA